jgi:hypothetical protein
VGSPVSLEFTAKKGAGCLAVIIKTGPARFGTLYGAFPIVRKSLALNANRSEGQQVQRREYVVGRTNVGSYSIRLVNYFIRQ